MPRRHPPLSSLRIQTHCDACRYPLPHDEPLPTCPECGQSARREITEDDTRLLTPAELAFLKRWRPATRPHHSSLNSHVAQAFLVGAFALVFLLLTGQNPQDAALTASAIAIGAIIGRLAIHRFTRPMFQEQMNTVNQDLADARAAVCYLDIQQSVLVTGDVHGTYSAFLFLRVSDSHALGFDLNTISRLFPTITTHAPTRLAIDFLPNTGILLTARAASEDTIPTKLRHAESIDLLTGVFMWDIPALSESIIFTDGEPTIFK